MNLNAVKQLADLLKTENLSSLTYEEGEFKVSLTALAPQTQSASVVMPFAANAANSATLNVNARTSAVDTRLVTVTAPVVGTVYRAREQGKAPLASLGDAVKAGDALCVIEAMKMFSEITAPVNGTVVEIAFSDGALAEFGSKLIVLEPTAESAVGTQADALQGGGK